MYITHLSFEVEPTDSIHFYLSQVVRVAEARVGGMDGPEPLPLICSDRYAIVRVLACSLVPFELILFG